MIGFVAPCCRRDGGCGCLDSGSLIRFVNLFDLVIGCSACSGDSVLWCSCPSAIPAVKKVFTPTASSCCRVMLDCPVGIE